MDGPVRMPLSTFALRRSLMNSFVLLSLLAICNGHYHLLDGQAHEHSHDRRLTGGDEFDPLAPCGMEDASFEDVYRLGRLASVWREKWFHRNHQETDMFHSEQATTSEELLQVGTLDIEDFVVVPVCIHVIVNSTGFGNLNDSTVQKQVDALNVAFSDASCCNATLDWCEPDTCSPETGFRFELGDCITRTVNDDWYYADMEGDYDLEMKQTLREGGVETLNIYIRDLPGGLGGRSWFPWWTVPEELYRDGVSLDAVLLADGPMKDYNEGDVLVHEVSHWLGLYHTFQNGCALSDGVMSTAAEGTPGVGCEIGRDTCPGKDGLDPIHNFLDYSTDECSFEFTMDQVAIMHAVWEEYRSLSSTGKLTSELHDNMPSAPVTLPQGGSQLYTFDTDTSSDDVLCWASFIEGSSGTPCSINCFNGDLELYARWDDWPDKSRDIYDCESTTPGSSEKCTVTPPRPQSKLYLELFAKQSVVGAILVCTQDIGNPLPLQERVSGASVTLRRNERQVYSYTLDARGMNLTCTASGSTEGLLLYARVGAPIDVERGWYDFVSSDSKLWLAGLPRDIVFFTATAMAAESTFTLTCNEQNPIPLLEDEAKSETFSLTEDTDAYFRFPVADLPHRSFITCTNYDGDSGNVILSLRWDDLPSHYESESDVCSRLSYDSNEPCAVAVPANAEDLYVRLHTWQQFADGVSVRCSTCLRFLGTCRGGEECCQGRCRLGRCLGF